MKTVRDPFRLYMTLIFLFVAAAPAVSAPAEGLPDFAPLLEDLSNRSHPPRYELKSFFNPWAEDLIEHDELPDYFGHWIVTAARAYARQGIRFDGYMGSDDDGQHYDAAADGVDAAYIGNAETRSYRVHRDGVVDDLNERVWICLDLPVHAVTLAGFPIRRAMADDFHRAPEIYTLRGTFPENVPTVMYYYRRVRNLRTYLERRQIYHELRVAKEEYRDPAYRPAHRMQPGDILLMGHYGDPEGTGGVWHPKHSGIVASVDDRGLPVTLYNMRVSRDLLDYFDGEINQTRTIEGQPVFFKRFSDRYSLIGFGRIVNPYVPEESEEVLAPEE
jgi:hypothetical protein